MKIDFNSLSTEDHYDFCIIGTGPAGITCALKLASSNKKVLLLEAGTDEITENSQNVYNGQTTGDEYFDLSVSRLRFFGGTSNHWGGYCRTLDACDFEQKGNFDTAWPISRKDIDGYLEEASEILEIDQIKPDIPFGNSGFNFTNFVFSPPVRFLDKYYTTVINEKNITLVLEANVTSIDSDGSRITGALIENYAGEKNRVNANTFILATGGIENSRLLLWSNAVSNGAVVKNSTTLGKYWMEHPTFTIGSAIIDKKALSAVDPNRSFYMAPNAQTINNNNILNCGIRINPTPYKGTKKLLSDLLCVAPNLARSMLDLVDRQLSCGFQVRASWEQLPVASNCITLGNQKDRFGVPRTNLHWEKTKTDYSTARKSLMLLGEYLAEKDIGRVVINRWLLEDDESPSNDELAGNHHMGGTRMAESAHKGIVDKNCKVFGQENLYIAGSSIFPSTGYANPTLTLVQLALRLSEHLKRNPSQL